MADAGIVMEATPDDSLPMRGLDSNSNEDQASDTGADQRLDSNGDGQTQGDVSRNAMSDARPDEAGMTAPGGCLSDADCTSSNLPRCETTLHTCVQCIGAPGDCANQTESVCNRVTDHCELPCTSNSDCHSPDVCDIQQGACADCLTDSQCESSAPHCVAERCVECTASSQCHGGEVCWQERCVACVTNADCHDAGKCSTNHNCI